MFYRLRAEGALCMRPIRIREIPGDPGQTGLPWSFGKGAENPWQSCLSPCTIEGAMSEDSVGMGLRPAKAHEKRWGRRFRLPTPDPNLRGWQPEAPAPPTRFFAPVPNGVAAVPRLVYRRA